MRLNTVIKRVLLLALIRFIFESILAAFILLIAALVIGGFFGELDWRLDLLSHFRVLYMIALMICIALSSLIKARIPAILATLILLVDLAPMLPYYWPIPSSSKESPAITFLQTNAWYRNPACEKVTNYIRAINPDVVAVEEYDVSCRKAFQQAHIPQDWPHRHTLNATRLGLFSKYPLEHVTNQFSRNGHGSAIIASIQTPQGPLRVIVVHATRPKSQAFDQYQREHLSDLARIIREETLPTVVIGDLNTTPWSRTYGEFIDQSGLKDSQRGVGIQPSWPSLAPLSLPMLPIDHVLVSPGIHVQKRSIGPDVGSDHRPVVAGLSLPTPLEKPLDTVR